MDKRNEVLILNIDDVLPNRFQPRIKFNEKNILELADSIREHGVIQPIVVRKISDKYEIIAGERRYKASILAGKTTIPAIVTNFDDKQSAEVALLENVQRQDLTPIEEAISYKKILDMGYINQTDLAEKLGKTQSTIANKLRLLNLSDEVQEALLEGKISERHARSLLKLKDKKQVDLLNRIISERMTVRKTDEEINKILNEPADEVITSEETISNEEKELNKNQDIEIVDFESDDNVSKESISSEIVNIKEENKEEGEQEMNQNNNIFNPFMGQNNPVNENPQPTFSNESNQNNLFNANQYNESVISNPMEQPIDNFNANQIVQENPFINNVQPLQPNNDDTEQQGGGRFFNIFENNNSGYVEDLESKEVNMNLGQPNINNNSNFNFNTVDTSIFSNQSTVENKPITSEFAQPVGNNVQQVQTEPVQNQSIINPFLNNVQPTAFNMPQQNDNIQPVQEPLLNMENNINDQMETNQNIFGPTSNLNINSNAGSTNEIPFNSSNMNQSIQENNNILGSVTQTNNLSPNMVPEQDLINSQLKPYSLDDEEEFVNQSAVEMPSANPFVQNEYKMNQEPPVVMVNNQQPALEKRTDLRTVINTIRNCSETIEKYGYNIDTEEIDFEDSYQVIFKIQK